MTKGVIQICDLHIMPGKGKSISEKRKFYGQNTRARPSRVSGLVDSRVDLDSRCKLEPRQRSYFIQKEQIFKNPGKFVQIERSKSEGAYANQEVKLQTAVNGLFNSSLCNCNKRCFKPFTLDLYIWQKKMAETLQPANRVQAGKRKYRP